MSEFSPRFSHFGFVEQALEDHVTEEVLVQLLEDVFPATYQGDMSVPIDPSCLYLCQGILERIWNDDRYEETRDRLFTIFYRSFEFVTNVVSAIKPFDKDVPMDVELVFTSLKAATREELMTAIYESGKDYLDDRPTLNALVERFAGNISPDASSDYVTAAMCGVWLKAYDSGWTIREHSRQAEDL